MIIELKDYESVKPLRRNRRVDMSKRGSEIGLRKLAIFVSLSVLFFCIISPGDVIAEERLEVPQDLVETIGEDGHRKSQFDIGETVVFRAVIWNNGTEASPSFYYVFALLGTFSDHKGTVDSSHYYFYGYEDSTPIAQNSSRAVTHTFKSDEPYVEGFYVMEGCYEVMLNWGPMEESGVEHTENNSGWVTMDGELCFSNPPPSEWGFIAPLIVILALVVIAVLMFVKTRPKKKKGK